MRAVLHLLTRPPDPLTTELIERQRAEGEVSISVIDLNQRQPDYFQLLDEIFRADSVAVW